jgi:hypothetical protein
MKDKNLLCIRRGARKEIAKHLKKHLKKQLKKQSPALVSILLFDRNHHPTNFLNSI